MYNFIHNLKKRTPIDKQLYFDLLKNNKMSFETFKESQTNFYGATCTLVPRVPIPASSPSCVPLL